MPEPDVSKYNKLPLFTVGYEHGMVVHDREFVNSEDRSVHTQNTEAHNRWTKAAVKSYRGSRSLNSYCTEYAYITGETGCHSFTLF